MKKQNNNKTRSVRNKKKVKNTKNRNNINDRNTLKKSKNIKKSKEFKKSVISNSEMNMSNKQDDSKAIINIAYIMIGLFVLVIGYFTYSMVTKSEDIVNNDYNQRQDLLAEQIVRGNIISADGKTLAHTMDQDGVEQRVYPYGDMFAHVVGRFSKGRTGIELSENFRLLTSNTNGLKQIYMDLTGQKNLGDNIITTLDYDLQKVAYDGLGNNKGAIVVLEPSSGKILAMVSKPSYDPNNIDNIWENVKDDNINKPLINRVTSEAYPPGSVFKVATILEYIRQNPDYNNYTYECNGTYSDGIAEITCVRAHGRVDLEQSMAVSCNSSLANIGANLNPARFNATLASLNLDTYLPEDLDFNHPFTSIGQGDVRVSPMQMAEFIAAIANGGVLMEPYVVDYIENTDGNSVKKFTSKIKSKNIESWEANILTEYMEEVINSGTATNLQSDMYTVAGKTGTAQNKIGSASHSWFVGYANSKNPEIAVSIIVENAPNDTKKSVPIAKDIFNAYFSKN